MRCGMRQGDVGEQRPASSPCDALAAARTRRRTSPPRDSEIAALAVERRTDDYGGLASLLVVTLRRPIPLPKPGPRTTKLCSRCGRDLPLDVYGAERRAKDRRRVGCFTCARKAAHEGYQRRMAGADR